MPVDVAVFFDRPLVLARASVSTSPMAGPQTPVMGAVEVLAAAEVVPLFFFLALAGTARPIIRPLIPLEVGVYFLAGRLLLP